MDPAGKKSWEIELVTFTKTRFSGPKFKNRNKNKRLDKGDAEYVECIHTGSDCYGIENEHCTADFYPVN